MAFLQPAQGAATLQIELTASTCRWLDNIPFLDGYARPSHDRCHNVRRFWVLLSRIHECESVDARISLIGRSEGGANVVHCEPGIGKTSLLDHALASSQGFEGPRAVGNEADMEASKADVKASTPGTASSVIRHGLLGPSGSWLDRTNPLSAPMLSVDVDYCDDRISEFCTEPRG